MCVNSQKNATEARMLTDGDLDAMIRATLLRYDNGTKTEEGLPGNESNRALDVWRVRCQVLQTIFAARARG